MKKKQKSRTIYKQGGSKRCQKEQKQVEEATWGKNIKTKSDIKVERKEKLKEISKNLKEEVKKLGEGFGKIGEQLAPEEEKEETEEPDLKEQLFSDKDIFGMKNFNFGFEK